MANVYRSVLNDGGGGGAVSSLKDAYRNKVMNSVGVGVIEYAAYDGRCELNEGRMIYESATNSVYVYFDFTMLTTMSSSDYWTLLQAVGSPGTSYLPVRSDNTRGDNSFDTDSSSTVPSNSFFVRTTSTLDIAIHKGHTLTLGDNYIIYGSWQY